MNTYKRLTLIFTKSILTFILLFSMVNANAQNDTIFYNTKWAPTVKDSASFYRPPIQKEGDLFRVQDFYISGQLQMSGLSKNATKDIWQGVVAWYTEKGKVYQQGTYENHRLNGEFISYDDKQKLVANYENGYFMSGEMISPYGAGNWYQKKEGDSLVQIFYGKHRDGIRYENYSTSKDGNYRSVYYDKGGKLIGERELLANGYTKGVEVFYYYGPMRVKQIIYSPFGQELTRASYYENGQVREEVVQGKRWSKRFYSEAGELLGSMVYELDGRGLKPFDGKEIRFGYGAAGVNGTYSTGTVTYEDGIKTVETTYYPNGKLQSTTSFENSVKMLQISYDEKGKENARMVYKDYRPFDGTETQSGRRATYSNGELVKETTFYRNTDLPLKIASKTEEIYYDKKGNVLGRLSLLTENGYAKPMDGDRYSLGYENGEVYSISTYTNGALTERTDFTKKLVAKDQYNTFKKITAYDKNGFNKVKETKFYSYDTLQSEITFEGYKEVNGVYYDNKGKQIGVYDYQKKEGTLYVFFSNSDDIELKETYKAGQLIASQLFIQSRNTDYRDIYPILVQEMDVDCCATFYTDEGKKIGELTYKNRLPWEGILYERNKRTQWILKEGKRNGAYKKMDYNGSIIEQGQFKDDKEQGLFTYYTYTNEVKKKEYYKDGKLNGLSSFYNKQGALIAQMEYENGIPKNGTRLMDNYSSYRSAKETYISGVITERVLNDRKGKRVTSFENGIESGTTEYYGDSETIKLKYRLKNSVLNGEVIRFDEKGKQQHKATLVNGVIESGTLWINSNDYDVQISHIELTKVGDELTAKVIGINGDILFMAKEKLLLGAKPSYIDRVNLYQNYLSANQLY